MKRFSETDRVWMRQALALGALAEGATSPNPRVGCVLVRDGQLVGQGFHRGPGRSHAETQALDAAGDRARGATLYVNLEPCAHHGRTPPCVERLLAAGVGTVVAAMQDPDPRVNGRGFEILRQAGVEVRTGLLEQPAARLNEAFAHWHVRRIPLVTMKAAISLDGMLSADEGLSRWISGASARCFAHRLRMRHDAVLVGAGTVRRDDPALTVRLPGVRAAPRRVVLSASLDLDPRARVFQPCDEGGGPVQLYTSERVRASGVNRFGAGVEVLRVPESSAGLDLGAVLVDLGSRGVQSVLVEGGGKTFAGLLDSGSVDRVAIFLAGSLLGGRGGTPIVDRRTVAEPALGVRLERSALLPMGDDLLLTGSIAGSSAGEGRGSTRCSRA